jgi:hypothetical protein
MDGEMGRACSTNTKEECVLDIDGKSRTEHTTRKKKRMDNIKMYVGDIGWDATNWIDMA